jgi:hypothetical protein
MSGSSPPAKTLPKGVPGCLKKRRLLNDPLLRPEACREYGEKFFHLGWWQDALDFFQKANDASALEKLRKHCLETGDAFLLSRLGLPQDPETWRQVADKALDLGKLHFARRAYEMAGDPEKAAMMEGLLTGAVASSEERL